MAKNPMNSLNKIIYDFIVTHIIPNGPTGI